MFKEIIELNSKPHAIKAAALMMTSERKFRANLDFEQLQRLDSTLIRLNETFSYKFKIAKHK